MVWCRRESHVAGHFNAGSAVAVWHEDRGYSGGKPEAERHVPIFREAAAVFAITARLLAYQLVLAHFNPC